MFIKAKSDGFTQYINPAFVVRFSVEDKAVFIWTADNLTIELEKTKELKDQLDKLTSESLASSKGFENFS